MKKFRTGLIHGREGESRYNKEVTILVELLNRGQGDSRREVVVNHPPTDKNMMVKVEKKKGFGGQQINRIGGVKNCPGEGSMTILGVRKERVPPVLCELLGGGSTSELERVGVGRTNCWERG